MKTFAYPIDAREPELGYQLIETRLLIFGEEETTMWTYVYDQDDPTYSDAKLAVGGPILEVSWIDLQGQQVTIDYAVPNVPSCRNCHGAAPATRSLGPSTGMLNREADFGGEVGVANQIDYFDSLGLFDSEPLPEEERTHVRNRPGG